MENTENLVTEQVTENVEHTTEESPKLYSQEEFDTKVRETVDNSLGKKIARREAKIQKENDRKYGDLLDVLRAGTGKQSVEELTDTFKKFYTGKGVKMPQKPTYSDRDNEILAKAEAEEIIRAGDEEVVEEVDRLTRIGAANMTPRERAVFKTLAEHRQNAERGQELSKIGVTSDVYSSKEFQEFASKFNPNTPITDVYNIYQQTKPKKNIKPMGSMKHGHGEVAKDFYTEEEISRLTEEDLDDPNVWEAVRRSMTGR